MKTLTLIALIFSAISLLILLDQRDMRLMQLCPDNIHQVLYKC